MAWNHVALTPPTHGAALGLKKRRPLPPYVAWLGIGAVVLHGLGAAYLLTRPSVTTPPRAHEVEVSLTPPPPPPPPPPKPEPQRREPPRAPPQPLPPIAAPIIAPTEVAETSEPVVAAPVAAPAPAPDPAPVTPPIGRAGYLDNPPPRYPPVALRQGWAGTVILKVRVLAAGTVASVEVQRSSGRKVLDDEAARTVQSWRFTPSKRGDTPIDGWATVPIEFKVE